MPKQRIQLHGVGPSTMGRVWESDRLLRVGRSTHYEVSLDDASISRRHAEIALTDQGWVVRDLGSGNGTFLNGMRLNLVEKKIQERDLIQCGNIVLLVSVLEEPEGAESAADRWHVDAATQHTWEEAVSCMATEVARNAQPGEQLLALLRTGQHLYLASSIEELLTQSLRDAVTLLKARRGAILQADATTGTLTVCAAYPAEPEGMRTGQRSYSSTMALRCFQSEESILCHDTKTDAKLQSAKSVADNEMGSIICALLRTPRQRLGVMHLDRSVFDPPFELSDLHLADGIAAGMSASVASAHLIVEKQRRAFFQMAMALAKALGLRDPSSIGHAQRVADYALLLADHLGLSATERHCIQIAAPLHDIGKLGVDDRILCKPERLTPAEYEVIQSHPVKGAALLDDIADIAPALPIIRNHHERWDGAGYPDRLSGEAIPRIARVVAVAEAFDAMTVDYPYRKAMPINSALAQIQAGAGSQFETTCAQTFAQMEQQLAAQIAQRAQERAKGNTTKLTRGKRSQDFGD